MDLLEESTLELYVALVREVAVECLETAPDMAVRLTVLKSGFMMVEYPDDERLKFQKRLIKKKLKYGSWFQRLIATGIIGSSVEKRTVSCYFLVVRRRVES